MNEVTFDVKLDENDLFKYNLRQTYRGIGVRIFSIIGVFGLIYIPIYAWEAVKKGFEPPIQIYLLFVITFFTINLPLIVKKSSRKMMAKNAQIKQTQHYQITEQKIIFGSENGNGQLTWDKVFEVREDKNFFTIYINKTQAYLIPKRFIDSPRDIETIRDIVKQSVPSDKQKLMQ
ncbi:MAG: YcxB family protein [Caulobacteraceae bacterium]